MLGGVPCAIERTHCAPDASSRPGSPYHSDGGAGMSARAGGANATQSRTAIATAARGRGVMARH